MFHAFGSDELAHLISSCAVFHFDFQTGMLRLCARSSSKPWLGRTLKKRRAPPLLRASRVSKFPVSGEVGGALELNLHSMLPVLPRFRKAITTTVVVDRFYLEELRLRLSLSGIYKVSVLVCSAFALPIVLYMFASVLVQAETPMR